MSEYEEGLKKFVRDRAVALYQGLQNDRGDAKATLARLRRGNGAPGSEPLLWEQTLGLPDQYSSSVSDLPTPAERAVYYALTLFAVHQQAVDEPMHRDGVSFGQAIRQLARREGASEAPVLRRFQAMATAEGLDEAHVHARGLVTQLRGVRIPMDYGQFAVDLLSLQSPTYRNRVRLAWGRDYYRPESRADNAPEQPTDSSDRTDKE